MGNFLYGIMSDIVLDLRKNTRKVVVFAAFLIVSFFVALIAVNGKIYIQRNLSGLFFALASGRKTGFWYFFTLVIRNAFSVLVLAACSCNPKVTPLWQVLFFFRMIMKFGDVMRAMQFFLVSCLFSAILCIVFEILVAAVFMIMYVDMCEKRINCFSHCDFTLLETIQYPACAAIVVLSAVQAIACSALIV